MSQTHRDRKFYIAHDSFMVGHARLLGDGRAEWYPGNAHTMRCVRQASELDIWREEALLADEVFTGSLEDDPPTQQLQDCWSIIESLLTIIARQQARGANPGGSDSRKEEILYRPQTGGHHNAEA